MLQFTDNVRPDCIQLINIRKYISYQFGGLVLDVFLMKAILYAALTLIAVPFARMGFKKHQVS